MKTTGVLLLILLTATAVAQVPPPMPPGGAPGPAPFPAALRLFLELSDAQIELLRNLNVEYARQASTRFRRVNQIQGEIADETAKSPLDPMALGLRYAEIETIRRQLNEELARLRVRVREALNDSQRARLRSLEEVVKILPIYSEAVQVNLIEPPGPVAGFGGSGIGRPVPFGSAGLPSQTDETP